jgi:hypothetical protein
MATTTTNFGWDIPQSTDLVKDGATAIAALGQDIDTAFVDFKGGTTGQVLKKTSNTDLDVEWGTASSGLTLINTTSFSAVSSQSINDVFSATYASYKIITNITTSVAAPSLYFRLRVSGTDTTSGYRSQYLFGNNTSIGGSRDLTNQWTTSYVVSNRPTNPTFNVHNPFATNTTTAEVNYIEAPIGNIISYLTVFGIDNTTSYTGCTIYPSTGTMTGSISILGLTS